MIESTESKETKKRSQEICLINLTYIQVPKPNYRYYGPVLEVVQQQNEPGYN